MVEINNFTDFAVDKHFFLGVAKKVLKGENKEMENMSVAFINDKEMQALNKKHRHIDKATDVLSFTNAEDFKGGYAEVVICPSYIKEKSGASGGSLKYEITQALVHGILHTLGYDHEISAKEEEKMFNRQKYYLDQLNF